MIDWPDSKHLRELIETTEQAIRNQSDAAIDGAKCLVECVCITILEEYGAEYSKEDSPSKLVNLTAKALGIDTENSDQAIKKIASGLITATQGLSELRNSNGPLGHGRHLLHGSVGPRHRVLAVATAEAIAVTLYEAYSAKGANLRYTSRPFDNDDEINRRVDMAVEVDFDEDSYEIVVNEFLTFRPSQILYVFDRPAYIELYTELETVEIEDDGNVGAS